MGYKKILNDIRKNDLKSVYLCYGKENYLKDWLISKLKNKYIDKSLETLNFIKIDGKESDVDKIINACETLPFMSEKKIVLVENLTFLSSKGEATETEKRFSKYVLSLSNDTCLFIYMNKEKVDKRKSIVKNIKKCGSVVELKKLRNEDLIKWIAEVFRKSGKNISRNEISHFIDITGYLDKNSNRTLYDLENEVNKVVSYIGQRKKVSRVDIDKVLIKSFENNIFKLVDGIGHRNPNVSLTIFNDMLSSNEPIQLIMYMIIRQFRLLLVAKNLEQKGYDLGSISKKLQIPRFVAEKLIKQSRNFTITQLKDGFQRCLETDNLVKKGRMDNRLAVEVLISGFHK